jgi:hypothetical protein
MIGTCYNKRFVAALMDLFPELDLQPSEFVKIPSINLISNLKDRYWESKENRVALFQQIALERGFNPLLPENWYHVTYSSLVNRKVLIYFFSSFIFKPFLIF